VSAEQDLVSPVDPWKALVFLVSPDQFGHPQHGDYTGPLGAHLNYQELVGGWVGRLVLTLAAFALWLDRRNPRTWFFAALALVAVLVAFQVPPFYDAARAVPLVKSSKLMRLLLLAALSFTVLGAFGLDRLLQRLRPRIASAAGLAVTLVVALELGTWGHGYNPAVERDSPTFLPPTPASDFLARDDSLYRVLGQDATILIPNANMFYGVDTLTGYDAMEYRTMAELVARLTSDEQRETSIKEIRWFDRPLPLLGLLNVKYVLATAALPPPFELVLDGDVRVYENPWALPRAFVATDAVVLEDADERLDFLASPELDPRVAVLEERPSGGIGASAVGAGAAVGPPGTVAVETYEPRRVLLRAEMSRPGLVVLADAWDAAWVARVDGADAPIERVDHTLRGVWVGRGESVIEMAHEPASIRVGLACAAVGVAACVALLALGAGRRRRALRPLGGEVR
jgi:hypothetical protein